MEKYVIVNRVSKMSVWQGSLDEAKQICFNPFVNEYVLKQFASVAGNDLYKKVE